MKNFFLAVLLLTVATQNLYSQQTTMTKGDYLKKSKTQKIAAWALLGTGVAAATVGVLIATGGEPSIDDAAGGAMIVIGGGALMLGSVPLFLASSRNKKKAMLLSIKNENTLQYTTGYATKRMFPALSVRIQLP